MRLAGLEPATTIRYFVDWLKSCILIECRSSQLSSIGTKLEMRNASPPQVAVTLYHFELTKSSLF